MPALLAIAVGGALLVLGWVHVSGEAAYENQTAGLNTAILGVLVILVGCGVHLFVLRRRVARRLVRVRRLWDEG